MSRTLFVLVVSAIFTLRAIAELEDADLRMLKNFGIKLPEDGEFSQFILSNHLGKISLRGRPKATW